MHGSGCMKNNYIEVHKESSCHSADAKTGDQGLDLRLLPQKCWICECQQNVT